MNIFEELRADHDKQRTLADLLVKTHGDSDGRAELYSRLKNELKTHADAEERHFYKHLISKYRTQDLTRHGIAEYHEMDELMEELDSADRSSSSWVATAEKLREKVHHHLEDEEHKFFQQAGKVFSEKQKEELAKSYRKYVEKNS